MYESYFVGFSYANNFHMLLKRRSYSFGFLKKKHYDTENKDKTLQI